jgi:hypothetical protein
MLLGCDASIRYELTNFNKGWLFNIRIFFFAAALQQVRIVLIEIIKPKEYGNLLILNRDNTQVRTQVGTHTGTPPTHTLRVSSMKYIILLYSVLIHKINVVAAI